MPDEPKVDTDDDDPRLGLPVKNETKSFPQIEKRSRKDAPDSTKRGNDER